MAPEHGHQAERPWMWRPSPQTGFRRRLRQLGAAVRSIVTVVLLSVPVGAAADDGALPLGERTIFLVSGSGEKRAIGTIAFAADGATARTYEIRWDDSQFANHFLSMRPFKCVETPKKLWCHVPYPYENRRRITTTDLTDLEYDLLFLWKGAGDYGINMWNGIYYPLRLRAGRLTAELHEMDMDILAAPPEDGSLRPISSGDIEPGDRDSHLFPQLSVE